MNQFSVSKAPSKLGVSDSNRETEGSGSDEMMSNMHVETASDFSEDDEENSSSRDDSSNVTPESGSGNSSSREGGQLFGTSKEDRHIVGCKVSDFFPCR